MNEFELIRQYFLRPAHKALLGNGDDCALIAPGAGNVLAVSSDMLVAGRHFFADVDPCALGFKSLAVNLSDLAAMCAKPLAFTLALALPNADASWLAGYAKGLFACAERYGCELVGGDTTRGPLTISITVMGEVPLDLASRRSAARIGDDIWVSGELGGAALALALKTAGQAQGSTGPVMPELVRRLEYPTPRVELGLALRGMIHAMIDVSDGLFGDLRHMLDASACGALLREADVPMPAQLLRLPVAQRRTSAFAGGDDYELCFTAAAQNRDAIASAAKACQVRVTRIGEITAQAGLRLLDGGLEPVEAATVAALCGFDHFG